ncbi:MAG TPA: hypothetical protein VFW25_04005 [Silvibacterium sp.]|nr:hypothetical protein [Silvibacterium sp.]
MKGFLIPLLAAFLALPAAAQVFTVTPEGVDAKYLQFTPTSITLSALPLTHHDRQELLRFLQSEQGFTMRPMPVATLVLRANGEMKPGGSAYANLVRDKGIAAKAGERVVITDVAIEKDRILLDFNGGPVHKHKFLRHISIGMDPNYTSPIVRDNPNESHGSRIALVFPHGVPELTGLQVEALVKPIVDFTVKTPIQAYTDTLPPFLRKAVTDHQVLVGMNHDMVLSALGQPKTKMREEENQVDVEIWIYGDPPQPTQFVRFNGNRVIRFEVARVGKPIEVHAKNEMGDYWSTQQPDNVRIVKLGDQAPVDAAKQAAPAAPPTLRNPGEVISADKGKNTPQMQPVEFPKGTGETQQQGSQTTSTQPAGTQPTIQPATAQPATTQPNTMQPSTTQPAPAQPPPAQPATTQPSPSQTPPADQNRLAAQSR